MYIQVYNTRSLTSAVLGTTSPALITTILEIILIIYIAYMDERERERAKGGRDKHEYIYIPKSPITILPAALPLISMSKNTLEVTRGSCMRIDTLL